MKIQKKVKSLNLINVDLINVYWSLLFSPCRCLLELNKFCREDTQRANYSTSCILCLHLSYTYFWPASNSLFQPLFYIYIYIYIYTLSNLPYNYRPIKKPLFALDILCIHHYEKFHICIFIFVVMC